MGKQKVVMRVMMADAKKRLKALKTAVGLPGVISVAVEEDDKDRIVVIGDGIDSVALAICLRKRLGFAELISVALVEEKKDDKKEDKKEDKKDEDKSMQPPVCSYAPYPSFCVIPDPICSSPCGIL